jgi:hypothetical protein
MHVILFCLSACLSPCFAVAAFLASRNKPSVDKQLFDDGSGFKRRSGVRRRNVMGASRQVRLQHSLKRCQIKQTLHVAS